MIDEAGDPEGLRVLRSLVAIAALALLYGCASVPEPTPATSPEERDAIDIVVVPAIPAPERPETETGQALPPPSVTVVISSRSAAFENVATELANHFETLSIYDLSDKSQPPIDAFRLINDSDTDAVVAVGLRAARSAVALSDAPVVFSQVFNHEDHALLGDTSRGVQAIAPMDAQLAAWKEAEPGLGSVGIVIGPGHDALLDDARLAADRLDVELTVYRANSDQEALFYYKRMIRDIDGFWLLPDNRILSARLLKEIIAQANRQQVSVLVPNPGMLSLGASVSVSTVAADIAARIRDVVNRIHRRGIDAVAPLTALTEVRVVVNEARLRTAAGQKLAATGGGP